MNKLNYKIINILLIVLIIFFISKSIYIYKDIFSVLLDILIPILVSFFISYTLYPCVLFFTKKFSYNTSSFIILVIILLIFFLIFYLSIPIFYKEIIYFSNDISYFLSKYSIFSNILAFINNFLSFENSILFINNSASFITKFLFIFILSIYFLFNMKNIKYYFSKYDLFNSIDKDLFSYYKGFYLVILIEIIEYLVIYLLIGHPYYLLIAFLSGITSIIPFLGAIFTNLLALITSITVSIPLFIMTSVVMILVPIFNTYFVEPKIYNKTLNVPFISIIISCFTFGTLFGFLGIILSIPLYLILRNLCVFFFKRTP